MEILFTPEALISLVTLTFMEIVLGIDNIIFVSIVAAKLPEHQQKRTRNIGLLLALVFRILLLLGITWLVGLTKPVFHLEVPYFGLFAPGWRDLILLAGGIFLFWKSVTEMHEKMEDPDEGPKVNKSRSVGYVIMQIVALDIVFSFDSILTAVGLVDADKVLIMIIAVVIAMAIMMLSAGKISAFIEKRPTMKMLALAFLLLIGFMLVLEGLGQHIPKGYIYFAMLFSFGVELLNNRVRKNEEKLSSIKSKAEE